MRYCPNCSAYLGERASVEVCAKCGYNIRTHVLEKARQQEKTQGQVAPDSLYAQAIQQAGGELQTGKLCPVCQTNLMPLRENEFAFNLLGKNVPVAGVEYGQMRIMKRVVTELRIIFDAWVCMNDHHFYSRFREVQRFLCPVCKENTTPFGSMIRTCRRCNYNFQSSDFVLLHPRELMDEEGWVYRPELES